MLVFGDDQIAKPVDRAGLAGQEQRGGVELRQDRRSVNARAGAELVAGIDSRVNAAALQAQGLRADSCVRDRRYNLTNTYGEVARIGRPHVSASIALKARRPRTRRCANSIEQGGLR